MELHWLDGFRALKWGFWKACLWHPVVGLTLLALVIAVALRDGFLWLVMGNRYLDE
jgi:hypothetical protein